MKSQVKLPNDENLDSTIQNDTLGRNFFIRNFIRLLASIEGNYSIALDGRWGSGKTFFVKQTVRVIEELFTEKEEKNNTIRDNKDLKDLFIDPKIKEHKMKSFYFDAWKHDNQQDPLLSLIFELAKLNPLYTELLKEKPNPTKDFQEIVYSIANFILNKSTGFDFSILEDCRKKKKNILSCIDDQSKLNSTIDTFLTKILPNPPMRLIIFIDELDRCRPDFAVQLLERIKHYMILSRITFVFSINSEQLQHTIKRYYGDGFEASIYLHKFFDLPVKLPSINLSNKKKTFQFDKNSKSIFNKWCHIIVDSLKFEVRELIYFQEFINQTIYIKDEIFDKYNDSLIGNLKNKNKTLDFLNFFFAPLALAYYIADINLYYDFIDGKNKNLMDILINNIDIFPYDFLSNIFLHKKQSKIDAITNNNDQTEKIVELFYKLYTRIFTTVYDPVLCGKFFCSFYIGDSMKSLFINQLSLLNFTKTENTPT